MKKAPTVSFYYNVAINDAEKIACWLDDQRVTEYLNEKPETSAAIISLLNNNCSHLLNYHFNKDGRFILINNGQHLIGFIKLVSILKDEYEIVIVIGERQLWGQGYGHSALEQCLKFAFFELRAKKLRAKIHSNNKRSIKIFTICGFKKINEKNLYGEYELNVNGFIEQLKNHF